MYFAAVQATQSGSCHDSIDFSYLPHKFKFLKVFVIEAKRIMHWTRTGQGFTVQLAGYEAAMQFATERGLGRKRAV